MISLNELISRCPLLVVNQDHGFESRSHHQMEQFKRADVVVVMMELQTGV
jgi:hypothetical protein